MAGVKYLKIRVTRRQPLYETSVTDICWPLHDTFGHYIRDWSLAYYFIFIFSNQNIENIDKFTQEATKLKVIINKIRWKITFVDSSSKAIFSH